LHRPDLLCSSTFCRHPGDQRQAVHHAGHPTDLGILWFLALAGFACTGSSSPAGHHTTNTAFSADLRAAAQVISYEIPMGLAIISALVVYGTVNLTEIAQFQGQLLFGLSPMWGVVLQPLGAIIFIVAAFAEANRTPFDLAEGESELVAGFHVEYSSMKFGMFFMGEYVAMFTSSAIIVTLVFRWLPDSLAHHRNTGQSRRHRELPAYAAASLPSLFCSPCWMQKNNKTHYERANDPRKRETEIYIPRCSGLLIGGIEILLLF
jgi:NADH-quinone oxidoreductase subunit H